MGVDTKIEWTDHTFNPWDGCEHATLNGKPSPGCDNCYAEAGTGARVSRGKGLPLWGPGAHRQHRVESGWAQPERWFRAAVRDGVRRRVFCASQGDVFEDRRDLDAARERLWVLIERTSHEQLDREPASVLSPGLDWLLLTKRPENVMRLIPERWRAGLPPNVWIGTSGENQEAADARIPHLLRVPARVRFLSLEPLLGPVDLGEWLESTPLGRGMAHRQTRERSGDTGHEAAYGGPDRWVCEKCGAKDAGGGGIHWLIIGGESRGARPCEVAWIRGLRDQGRGAGVAVFVKQLGATPVFRGAPLPDEIPLRHPKGGDPAEWPEDLRVREVPNAL